MKLLQQNIFYTNKDLKNHTSIDVDTSIQLLPRNSQRINHTSSVIDPSPVVHCIIETIRGPNAMMNYQVYQ